MCRRLVMDDKLSGLAKLAKWLAKWFGGGK
jgi:hypothetical protein